MCVSHPQGIVDGVLLLVLRHHQCEGVCARAGQSHLGQVVGAVNSDAVDVGWGIGYRGRAQRGQSDRTTHAHTHTLFKCFIIAHLDSKLFCLPSCIQLR